MKKSELRKLIREVISEQIDPGKAVPLKGPKPSSGTGSMPQWTCDFVVGNTTNPNVWCSLVPSGQVGQYYSEEECIAAGCVSEGSNPDGYANWGCYANGNCVPQVNGPFQSEQECVNAGCGDQQTNTGNQTLGYTCPDVMPIFNASDYCVNASSPTYDQFVLECCSESGTATGNLPPNMRKKGANKQPSPKMNPVIAKKRARK